jgi:formylglycine-generating enzyme required for sulfatase activity
MKHLITSITIILFTSILFAQSLGSPPKVTNVEMEQIGGKVYVTYNLHIETNPVPCHVTLVISGDGEGEIFNIHASPDFLEGDVGDNVSVGTSKQILWDIYRQAQDFGPQGIDGQETYRARIIARRGDEWKNVQGTIDSGVTFDPGGYEYFNPGASGGSNYDVFLNDFMISRHEVTQAEFFAVMGMNPGSHNSEDGDALHHPINNVSWFDAIEYCNHRSIQEGLIPAYGYDDGIDYGTNPDDWPFGWNMSSENHTNISCDWDADGYSLPTEMQREFAARGGVPAATALPPTFNDTYAGTNIDGTGSGELGDYAWYVYNAGWELPDSVDDSDFGTHPVGTKLPNDLGLYDMSGNVANWVWDIWDSYPSGSYTDPTGPSSGTNRVSRGGNWFHYAPSSTVSVRVYSVGIYAVETLGFRITRNSP